MFRKYLIHIEKNNKNSGLEIVYRFLQIIGIDLEVNTEIRFLLLTSWENELLQLVAIGFKFVFAEI